jgi:hypothetical protein
MTVKEIVLDVLKTNDLIKEDGFTQLQKVSKTNDFIDELNSILD